jgi:uncharacterized protein YdhG (YjbR/CyaY superfamily)
MSPGRMSMADFRSVDEYIAAQPEASQKALRLLRSTIRKAAPRAEETISYKMPAYKLKGEPLFFFAGWRQHCSIYPASATIVAAFAEEIAPYFDRKSTLRFPLKQGVPVQLLERIVRFRVGEISSRPSGRLERLKPLRSVNATLPKGKGFASIE